VRHAIAIRAMHLNAGQGLDHPDIVVGPYFVADQPPAVAGAEPADLAGVTGPTERPRAYGLPLSDCAIIIAVCSGVSR
jgi:hypothetical protein